MQTLKKLIFLLAAILTLSSGARSQGIKKDSLRNQALNIFLDCNDCDLDFIRKEITFVNYVRERTVADVFLMVTSMNNGSGGQAYSFIFLGQGRFSAMKDTLMCNTRPAETSDEIRSKMVQTMKLGLVAFVAKTPLADEMTVTYSANEDADQKIVEDKWKSWVFSLSGSVSMNGEQSYQNVESYYNLSGAKVTPKFKTDFYASLSYAEYRFKYDTFSYTNINRSNSVGFDYILSLSDHWSAGMFLQFNSSTYNNLKLRSIIQPGIEYDLFAYKDASTKQMRFIYKVGAQLDNYIDTTIYEKTSNTLYRQSFQVISQLVKKWGKLYLAAYLSTYLHDLTKNSVGLSSSVSYRVTKGLEVNADAYYSMVHDQLNLPKGEATQEDVLLRQRQLETQYYYYFRLGLTYTFGSIYNNVVNPRFDGTSF